MPEMNILKFSNGFFQPNSRGKRRNRSASESYSGDGRPQPWPAAIQKRIRRYSGGAGLQTLETTGRKRHDSFGSSYGRRRANSFGSARMFSDPEPKTDDAKTEEPSENPETSEKKSKNKARVAFKLNGETKSILDKESKESTISAENEPKPKGAAQN